MENPVCNIGYKVVSCDLIPLTFFKTVLSLCAPVSDSWSDLGPVGMEGVPQNSSMGPPEVQFYLERVSSLLIYKYIYIFFKESALRPILSSSRNVCL